MEVTKSYGTLIIFKYLLHPEGYHPKNLKGLTIKKAGKTYEHLRQKNSIQETILDKYASEYRILLDNIIAKKLEDLK